LILSRVNELSQQLQQKRLSNGPTLQSIHAVPLTCQRGKAAQHRVAVETKAKMRFVLENKNHILRVKTECSTTAKTII
jgi:hypothetical protein